MVTYTTEEVTDGREVLITITGDVGPPALEEILKPGNPGGPVTPLLVSELGPLDEGLAVEVSEKLVETLLFEEVVKSVDTLDGVAVPAEVEPLLDEGGRLMMSVRVVVVVVKELKVVTYEMLPEIKVDTDVNGPPLEPVGIVGLPEKLPVRTLVLSDVKEPPDVAEVVGMVLEMALDVEGSNVLPLCVFVWIMTLLV